MWVEFINVPGQSTIALNVADFREMSPTNSGQRTLVKIDDHAGGLDVYRLGEPIGSVIRKTNQALLFSEEAIARSVEGMRIEMGQGR